MNARILPFHSDCIQPAPVRIPASLKAIDPNATAMVEDALEAYQRYGAACARDRTLDDEPDTRKLFKEIDRLEKVDEAMGYLLNSTPGVLVLLTTLWLEDKLSEEEKEVVAAFREAVKECGE